MYLFSFEKLEVWKKSREFTSRVYEITRSYPEEEKFGITSQLRRSAISVCSNLAEGASRFSPKDQRHFYNMAYSSLMENINQFLISMDLGLISKEDLETLRKETSTISYMINNLRSSSN